MKLPERLEHTDDLVAALVSSRRAAATPTPPTDEILARIERGEVHPLDELAPPTGPFRPLLGTNAWMIVGVLGAAVLSSAAVVGISEHRSSSSLATVAPAAPGTPRTEDPGNPEPAADIPPAIHSQDVESLPSVAVTSPRGAAVSSKPSGRSAVTSDAKSEAARAAPTSSLRRELELVEAARRALRGGDASACLSSVARYEEEFPSGQFTHEGQVMRIEAMALAGNHDKARRLAHAFLQANPKSPYADRVRSVLARVETP